MNNKVFSCSKLFRSILLLGFFTSLNFYLSAQPSGIASFSENLVFLNNDHLSSFESPALLLGSETNRVRDDLEMNTRLSTMHSIAGYTTVALGILAGVFNPEIVGDGFHSALGIGAAGMSALTLGLGYAAHHNEMSLESGFNPKLLHAALGIAGGVMMMITPIVAPSDAHMVLGIAGTAVMGISIGAALIY